MAAAASKRDVARDGARDHVRLLPYVVAGWLGAVSAYLYTVVVVQAHWPQAAELHRQIVDGTAASPYRSRILLPLVAEQLARFMTLESAYLLIYFVLFPSAFCLLYALLRTWYRPLQALLGPLVLAGVMPLALRDHYFQPATWLELVLMIIALRLLARPAVDLRWYAAIAVVAALNRETGIVLGLLLVVVCWSTHRSQRRLLGLCAAVPVVTYGVVRLVRGTGAPAEHDLLSSNLHDLPVAVIQLTLFAAVIGYLVWVGWAHAPAVLRRAALIVPPYLAFIAVYGIWRETRLLVPLLPIALGIALAAFTDLDSASAPPD